MTSSKLVLSSVIVSTFAICAFACAETPEHPPVNPYPVGMTHTTNAEVPQLAAWLSPGLRVPGSLAKRCALHRDDVEAAPHFGFDLSALDPEDEDVLLQLAKCVTSGPLAGRTLTLAHEEASDGGETSASIEQRTSRARKYLMEYGVASDRLEEKTTTDSEGAHRIDVGVAPR